MSWLDEELENKVQILMAGCFDSVAAQCLRSAYEGGFKDGAGELKATRGMLRSAAADIVKMKSGLEAAESVLGMAQSGTRDFTESERQWTVTLPLRAYWAAYHFVTAALGKEVEQP